MNLSKFQFGYEKHGIIGFINVLLSKLGFKYRLENQLKKLIIWHGKNIERISKNKIINGNYKDVKIQLNKNWSNEDVASKYLGLYELEVQECIINLQKNKKLRKKFLVNLRGYIIMVAE